MSTILYSWYAMFLLRILYSQPFCTIPILITCNIIYSISTLRFAVAATCYLVVPINTVKKSIEVSQQEILLHSYLRISHTGAGRLIPGINSLSENISALARNRDPSQNVRPFSGTTSAAAAVYRYP